MSNVAYINVLPLPVDIQALVPYGLTADACSRTELLQTLNHVLFLTLTRLEEVTGFICPERDRLSLSERYDMREQIRQDDIIMLNLRPAILAAADAIDYIEEEQRLSKRFPGAITRICDRYSVMIDVIHNDRGTDFQRARHDGFTQVPMSQVPRADHMPRRSNRVKKQREFYYGF
jgi:hypothetical protein